MSHVQGQELRIGWATTDLTPAQPVLVSGQFHARVSEGVADPITATAMAFESGIGAATQRAVLVSCDLVAIPAGLLQAVREAIRRRLPELPPEQVVLNATHTHTAPDVLLRGKDCWGLASIGVELPVMAPADYVAFAAERIAAAVAQAWNRREPGGIGFGLGQAVVGHNRRICYTSGQCLMYGATNRPDFSHVEGYEDHAVNLLATWNRTGKLTGLMVNLACSAQVSEADFRLSADYWCETRAELRRRFGAELYVLAQCSAAGDQSPHVLIGKAAEERMLRLQGRTTRQEIAMRIADTITAILPAMEKELLWNPVFAHRAVAMELPRNCMTPQDVQESQAEAAKLRVLYEAALRDLAEHPEKRQEPRWYCDITETFCKMKWNEGVAQRFRAQETQPTIPVEFHVLRLGAMAVATNPFEYYLDYGMYIKARSPAVQTFLVQLTGSDTYVPSLRSTQGGGYGSLPASIVIGPDGGHKFAERTVEVIDQLWVDQPSVS